MDLQLNNKIAIVTGGASGIGEAIVQTLVSEGAVPVIFDIQEEKAAEIAVAHSRQGAEVFVQKVELTNDENIRKAVAAVLEKYGRIDVLINNAGKNDGVALGRPVEDFRKSLELNLVQIYATANACLEALITSKGAIVNIGSKVAETGQGGTSGYAAAKGGVSALTREWAVQLLPHGIRVNAVIPAEVWTPLYEYVLSQVPDPQATKAQIEKSIPLHQRMTTPGEIADMVVFLASDRASHITGQLVHVDGGYTHLDRAVSVKATADTSSITGQVKAIFKKFKTK
jgi:L-fucose dehydrogenase